MVRLALVVICWISIISVSLAAPFSRTADTLQPTLLLAEIDCYGEREMRPEFFQTLWECMAERLQAEKEPCFRVDLSRMNDGTRDVSGADDASFRLIHMDAIAHGALYRRENASAPMARYADKLYGRDYFWDEAKIQLRRERKGLPYRLSPDVENIMRAIAEKYGADYLLFCNLWDVNTELKKSIFSASTVPAERAKKLQLEMDYYLINVKTGQVYEGHNTTSKRGQIINILFGKYGKGATVQQLLQVMFEVQAERTVKDVYGKGRKMLEAHQG